MTVNILRWQGGFAGDIVLKLILESNPTCKSNTIYGDIEQTNGQTLIDQQQYAKEYDKLTKILMDVDYNQVRQELAELAQSDHCYLIKSHKFDFDYENTVDIIVDSEMLPFVVRANTEKTPTLTVDYNNLVNKIPNLEIKKKYSYYNLAKTFIQQPKNTQKLNFNKIYSSWQNLQTALENLGFKLDNQFQHIHDTWLQYNKKYCPSQRYLDYIGQKEYNYNDTNLDVVERYCLLALSEKKFIVLD